MRVKHITESWADWVDQADREGTHVTHDTEWAGASRSEALRLAREGWQDATVADADAFAARVKDNVFADRLESTFEWVHDMSGSEVDIDRYLSGIPENMIEAQPITISRAGRAVSLVVPITVSGGQDTVAVRNRGSAILALVECLRRAQHPLDIWVVYATSGESAGRGSGGNPNSHWSNAVKVQAADQPLHIGRIMFAVAHEAMCRQLGFLSMDTFGDGPEVQREFHFGSRGYYPFNALPDDIPPVIGTTIVLPPMDYADRNLWLDEAHVTKWVTEQLDLILD